MRDESALALPDACVVQARALTSDGQGGRTETWATAVTTTCRVSPSVRQTEEVTRADGTKAVAEWTVTLPYATSVSSTSRLVVNGVTYEVVGLRAPRSWELTRRCLCKTIS